MANIFTLENVTDFSEKINLDDLYEKKRQHDLNKLALYNKILNRIHVRIKTTSRQKTDEHFCWYVIPEIIIGVPKYDQGSCIAYMLDKLKENGFQVKYIHPNTLFICWNHWVPSYVRTELKKKTGIIVDEYGRKIEGEDDSNKSLLTLSSNNDPQDINEIMFKVKETNNNNTKQTINLQKKFTPIKSYKPSGNLIYDDELLNRLEDKLN
jgi:phage antirepressor YoqD-like protein